MFQQYFDTQSSTFTYLIGDTDAKEAALIDTVLEHADRDSKTCRDLDFKRIYLLSTHVHADHVTGNAAIKQRLGSKAKSVISKYYSNAQADIKVGEDDRLKFGKFELNFAHTPGHTSGCICIIDHNNKRVFTGDTLLIDGCGRTDFQGGSSEDLYTSVHNKLFTLPRQYTVYPAHDYKGKTKSSIGYESDNNPRLTKSKGEFIKIMGNLNLAYPSKIDVAVPRNLNCGYDGSPE